MLQFTYTRPGHVQSIESLLSTWLNQRTLSSFSPTWSKLLQIIRLLNLHDLAERVESCLKSTTVDDQQKVAEGTAERGN